MDNTTESISADIHDAIAKNLPAQVGDVLKQELQILETLRNDNARLKSSVKDKDRKLAALDRYRGQEAQLNTREQELNARAAELERAEFRAELQKDFYESQRKDNIELVKAVFRRDLVMLGEHTFVTHPDGSSSNSNTVVVDPDAGTSKHV